MDDKDWLILITIKEECNLTKAAAQLFLSQPALTYRLHNLEKEFGTKILDRHSNGVSFTMQGESILKYAEEMLEKLKSTKKLIQSTNPPVQGTLRLGISTVFAKFKIAPLLKVYQDQFPDVNISLRTGSSTLQLPNMLVANDIDIAILRGDIDWPEKKHTILEEPWCLIYSHQIELNQLPAIPWILHETAAITKADKLFDRWWQDQFSSSPPTVIRVNSIEACIQLVSHGIGWSIIPKIYLKKLPSLFIFPLFFRDGNPLLKKTIMVYKAKALEQAAAKEFVGFVLKTAQHSHSSLRGPA
jgi:DNA-binding transcriptional LysR family regulator